jgi:hypothetical protein
MSANAARTGTVTGCFFEGGSVIGFKDGQGGVKQLTFGDHDHVEPLGDVVATKNFSNQSFGSIALNGAAELSRSRNTQSSDRALVWQDEQRAIPTVRASSPLVHLLEFCAASNPFGGTKSGHRGPKSGATRSRPTDVCGLWRAGV